MVIRELVRRHDPSEQCVLYICMCDVRVHLCMFVHLCVLACVCVFLTDPMPLEEVLGWRCG